MDDGFTANPEKIVEKGERVLSIAQACLNEFDSVDKEALKVGNAWDDEASRKYVAQINGYRNTFSELQVQVNEIGQVLIRHGNRLIEDRDSLSRQAEDL